MAAPDALGPQFATNRESFREAYRLAQVPQRARAEDYSHGHKSEEQSFYGHRDRPQTDSAETKLTVGGADDAYRAHQRHEREQKDAHASGTADYDPKPVEGFW